MNNDLSVPTPFAALAQAYLPRFSIQVPLGAVANGEIFRATDLPTGDQVLVKVIPSHLQSEAGGASWQLLREETGRLNKLFHPRLSNLLEIVDAPEALIVVMTLPAGTPMRRYLETRTLSRGMIIQWMSEILALLTEAHTVDVVHRFLSMNALIVDASDQLSLCGFSLTSFAPSRALLLSPEQRAGLTADARSDVYGVGMLLRLLLERAGAEGELGKADPLSIALLKALAELPADRFADPFAMATMLREARDWSPRIAMDPPENGPQSLSLGTNRLPEELAAPRDTVPLPVPSFAPPAAEDPSTSSETQAVGDEPTDLVPHRPMLDLPVARRPRVGLRPALAGAVIVLASAVVAYWLGRVAESARGAEGVVVETVVGDLSLATAGPAGGRAGRATRPVGMASKEMPPKEMPPKEMPQDATHEAIQAFVRSGVVDNLFNHASLPESDRALLEEVSADLAGLDFHADPRGESPVDTLFANNPLLDGTNPFLSDASREHWLAVAAHEMGSDNAIAHLEAQSRQTSLPGFSRADWYEHVAVCQKLCGMVVVGLFYEHVRKVEESPHELVRFPTDSQEVDARGRGQLQRLLSRTGPTDRVLLIGRASRVGDRVYNHALSVRRVDSVVRAVEAAGVDRQRIHGFGLGYEPPQLTPEVARRYGLEAGSVTGLNQSVLVVTYTPSRQTS